MSAGIRKSKKRSGASSKPPPKPALFLDRNLGKHIIAKRLRDAGMTVEVHDDHLPMNAPDEDWIALVGRKGWVAVTKDKNIRYRTAELNAIRKHSARVIVIRMKNATGPEIADVLVKGHRRIARFTANTPAPCIAGIQRSGLVSLHKINWQASA